MTCTCNPSMSYAAWCEAISRVAARTGKRIAFGDGTFEAWRDGKTPEAYVATLPHTSEPRKKNPSGTRVLSTIPMVTYQGKVTGDVYRALLTTDGQPTLKIEQRSGNGWFPTPGQWYLVDLMGPDLRGRRDNARVPIDYGADWFVENMDRLVTEASAAPHQRLGLSKNPSGDETEEQLAIDKYEEFHRYAPKHLDKLEIRIPTRVRELGAAKHVLYRSGKVDPSTLKKPKRPVDYIHEHDAGVVVYACDGQADTDVPAEFTEIGALTVLGKCLGFALKDGTEAEGIAPLPDLCCTPDGKCLMVVQDRSKVLFMIWGGALGVFARGIDG